MEKATRIEIKKLISILQQIDEGSIYCNIAVSQEDNDVLIEEVVEPKPSKGFLTTDQIEELLD